MIFEIENPADLTLFKIDLDQRSSAISSLPKSRPTVVDEMGLYSNAMAAMDSGQGLKAFKGSGARKSKEVNALLPSR